MEENAQTCTWCSTPIPPGASACPKCGAHLKGGEALQMPGVTTIDPDARLEEDEGLVPDIIDPVTLLRAGHGEVSDGHAFDPPSEEVLAEMHKIELEVQIANAGGALMSATGDEAKPADAPSEEAVEAFKAGLLDKTGPAGETDMAEHVAIWGEDAEER